MAAYPKAAADQLTSDLIWIQLGEEEFQLHLHHLLGHQHHHLEEAQDHLEEAEVMDHQEDLEDQMDHHIEEILDLLEDVGHHQEAHQVEDHQEPHQIQVQEEQPCLTRDQSERSRYPNWQTESYPSSRSKPMSSVKELLL